MVEKTAFDPQSHADNACINYYEKPNGSGNSAIQRYLFVVCSCFESHEIEPAFALQANNEILFCLHERTKTRNLAGQDEG